MYTKNNARKAAVRWEYSSCVAFSCKTAITIDLEMKIVTSSTPSLPHGPHDTSLSATKLRTMREPAGRFRGTLTQILADITSDAPI